jgi:hypothetical protein
MEFNEKCERQGLAVIGVSMDEDGWKSVSPFLPRERDPEKGGKTAMKYPVVIGNDTLAKEYDLTNLPMTLLIDRSGKIALSDTGVVKRDDFEGHILQLLRWMYCSGLRSTSGRAGCSLPSPLFWFEH